MKQIDEKWLDSEIQFAENHLKACEKEKGTSFLGYKADIIRLKNEIAILKRVKSQLK